MARLGEEHNLERATLHSQIQILMDLVNEFDEQTQLVLHLRQKMKRLEILETEIERQQMTLQDYETYLYVIGHQNKSLFDQSREDKMRLEYFGCKIDEATHREKNLCLEISSLQKSNSISNFALDDIKRKFSEMSDNVDHLENVNKRSGTCNMNAFCFSF